jgi:DNA mismatch repair protein MutL
VVESEGGLIIVDQHAAHERIIYERFRGAFRERKIEIQNLLAPINLDLDPPRAALLFEKIPLLKQLGIEIEPFGKNSFIITALPAIFSGWSREKLVLEFIDEMGDEGSKPDDPREEIIIRMSCLAAVKARAKLASVELTRLMEDLLACEDPDHCPHGRPTIIVDSWGELEKRFGRK